MEKMRLKVALTALAFPRRDLSPALVALVESARRDSVVRQEVEFELCQFLYRDSMESAAGELCAKKADVYAFSCYVWNFYECLELVQQVKAQLPQAVILLGGPEASGLAEHLVDKYDFVDYVIRDEGEEPFRKLLLYMLGKLGKSEVPALVYRNETGAILQNPGCSFPDPSAVPSPYASEYYRRYLNQVREPVTVTFETARGCPFECRYCS
jgi:radical SAM superfamily enzyme YgiQ (UPF0313 family)